MLIVVGQIYDIEGVAAMALVVAAGGCAGVVAVAQGAQDKFGDGGKHNAGPVRCDRACYCIDCARCTRIGSHKPCRLLTYV